MDQTRIVLPDHPFSGVGVIDLGDRLVELLHPGRGHTDGDLVVVVPDARLVCAGDLVEESDTPWIGEDSFPLEWPGTLDVALGVIPPGTVVVPGHGVPVDRAFVEAQRMELATVADQVRALAASGVAVDDAVASGEWPWEPDEADRVRRAAWVRPPPAPGQAAAAGLTPAGGFLRRRDAPSVCVMSETTPDPSHGGQELDGTDPDTESTEDAPDPVESEQGVIGDDRLPEDLRPTEDNPLAQPLPEGEEADLDIEAESATPPRMTPMTPMTPMAPMIQDRVRRAGRRLRRLTPPPCVSGRAAARPPSVSR